MSFVRRKYLKPAYLALPLLLMAIVLTAGDGYGRTMPKDRGFKLQKPALDVPNTTNVTHRISNIWFTVTNWGYLGSAQDPNILDCETGEPAPSCQFPAGSHLEYLFQGAIWIGAIVDGDTLVSCGTDGWWDTHEFFPDKFGGGEADCSTDSTGAIWLGSTRPATAYPRKLPEGSEDCYPCTISVENSISEEDFIAYYADTNVTFAEVDPIDQRPLRPIGLEIEQKSYSWSYEYAEDFIIFDFKITNISDSPIEDMWIAFHIDADVHHESNGFSGAQDDMTGFLEVAKPIENIDPLDINTAYIMDNDGDPSEDWAWDYESVRGVTGVRVVRTPGDVEIGFNWWISNINSQFDWGPQRLENYSGTYPGGGRGTPGGDPARYRAISNNEFDYDQAFAAINYSADGWINPLGSAIAKDLANGYDTRYTYSFGPFDQILPGDSLLLTAAYVAGEDLHANPRDFNNLFLGNEENEEDIQTFINSLDFSDFALNATWAEWVYDNPGVDTDEDGYAGEFILVSGDTIWIEGDGVPDFAGPPPPPSPELTFDTYLNRVDLRWDGEISEYTPDAFGNGLDFEGYKVYRSRTSVLNDFVLLGSFDRIDYDRYIWDDLDGKMELSKDKPWSLEELLEYANADSPLPGDTFEFDNGMKIHRNFAVAHQPPYTPTRVPTINGNPVFRPHAENTGCYEDSTYGQDTDGDGVTDDELTIRSEILDSTIVVTDSSGTKNIHYYTYALDGVLPSVAYFYSVTAFDVGDPRTQLAPLEGSKAVNMRAAYAIDDFDKVTEDVYVYPNPYVLDGSYREEGWEDLNEDPAYSQRIYFANLPGKCTIRIFTLDGDLVDQIPFDPQPGVDQPITSWDLISRNTQSIVSGIYLFSVDSEEGRQIGKFVIIK
ncbi:MAG: hypothetical protein GF315_12780 [candidate division Zixibacteria bacterium]|nr:hypothetical protein [candidate division Zixibacteria bacterium]